MPPRTAHQTAFLTLSRRALLPLLVLVLGLGAAGSALAQDSISEITVVYGGSGVQAPPGYIRYGVDLNRNAGGDYMFLCTKKGVGAPVTGITVTINSGSPPPGYAWTKINIDLNRNAGGDFIYLWYTRDPACGTIKDIVVLINSQATPAGYVKIPIDLNRDAGGDYLYFAFYVD